MYIVTEQHDYEALVLLSAHAGLEAAMKAAATVIASRLDAWDIPSASRGADDAGNIGPAARAIACWRVYDLITYAVFEVVPTTD